MKPGDLVLKHTEESPTIGIVINLQTITFGRARLVDCATVLIHGRITLIPHRDAQLGVIHETG